VCNLVHRVPRRASLQGISARQTQVDVCCLRRPARVRLRPLQEQGTWVTAVVRPEIAGTHVSQEHSQAQRDGHGVPFLGTILTCCVCVISCTECPVAHRYKELAHGHFNWNALQRTTTHCNALQRTAKNCNKLQHTATHCIALQHTATHCNMETYDCT